MEAGWTAGTRRVNGLLLHVVEAGPANGPLLILLHGFPEFWWGWRRQITPLAEQGYRVVVPDMRGYNRSEAPRDVAAYALDTLVADVAALADAGLTAYHAVRKAVPTLWPGTTAVVQGAGGLGHIGIQCLKAYTPTEIIVVDPSEPALELARELGADHTVRVDGSQRDAVKEITDGAGAEAIIDFVGEKGAIEDGIEMVQDGGFYYVIGYGENLDIPTIDVISREISFIGNLVGTYVDLQDLMTLTAQGKVTLHTSTYPLDAINDAMADLDGGRVRGRAILVP